MSHTLSLLIFCTFIIHGKNTHALKGRMCKGAKDVYVYSTHDIKLFKIVPTKISPHMMVDKCMQICSLFSFLLLVYLPTYALKKINCWIAVSSGSRQLY